MPESCPNCGAELYGGQQFCRRCGTPVGAAAGGGEAPTQLFPGGAQAAPPAAGTSPLGGNGAHTDSVAGQRPTAYQLGAGQQTSALVGQPFGSQPLAVGAQPPPAPRRRRGLWLFALLAVFVLGAGLATAGAFIWWRATRQGTVVRVVKTAPPRAPAAPTAPEAPPVAEMPGIPADLGGRIQEALKEHGVPLPLDESEAVVSGDATTLTRTFELDSGASFKAHVLSGNVTVVGTDEDEAVVKIVKRGGSAQERAATPVLAAESDEGVTLLSPPTPHRRVSVSYEISLPRGLRQLEISVNRGDVSVREFAGGVRSNVVSGNTRVFFPAAEREGAQEFSVVRGNIEATLADGAGADLKAEATKGDIELDEGFGLRVERAPAGRRASGRLGGGGDALLFKVTDGDIRIKK